MILVIRGHIRNSFETSYLYNLVKDKTPPVTNGSNKTIITQN